MTTKATTAKTVISEERKAKLRAMGYELVDMGKAYGSDLDGQFRRGFNKGQAFEFQDVSESWYTEESWVLADKNAFYQACVGKSIDELREHLQTAENDGEAPDAPISDWRYQVANSDTVLGYWEWVHARYQDTLEGLDMI